MASLACVDLNVPLCRRADELTVPRGTARKHLLRRTEGRECCHVAPPSSLPRPARDPPVLESRVFVSGTSGELWPGDRVSRIAFVLDEISLDEALRIAAHSLELGLDDSYVATKIEGSGATREAGDEDYDDDTTSIDSELRHLAGFQESLYDELFEIDRLAKSSFDLAGVDEMSELSSSFDRILDGSSSEVSDCGGGWVCEETYQVGTVPFQLFHTSVFNVQAGSFTSLAAACDMLASQVLSPPMNGLALSRASGIVPLWLRGQLKGRMQVSPLHDLPWCVPVVGSCSYSSSGGSVLLLTSTGVSAGGGAESR